MNGLTAQPTRGHSGMSSPTQRSRSSRTKADPDLPIDDPEIALGADRFRKQDGTAALDSAGAKWPRVWRGAGRGERADGSADTRAFRDVIANTEIAIKPNQMFRLAIEQATVTVDGLGNPRIEKLSENTRIDLVQAGAIAAGLMQRYRLRRKPGPSFVVAEPAA